MQAGKEPPNTTKKSRKHGTEGRQSRVAETRDASGTVWAKKWQLKRLRSAGAQGAAENDQGSPKRGSEGRHSRIAETRVMNGEVCAKEWQQAWWMDSGRKGQVEGSMKTTQGTQPRGP